MKKLTCKNCKHSETLEKINGSAITKILIAEIPRQRKKDGLNIYPLYCLECNFITEWASDSQGVGRCSINGIEYFKTFKINKIYKSFFDPIESSLASRGYTQKEYLHYGIGWFLIIIFLIAVFK
jgi:hypothetical protein